MPLADERTVAEYLNVCSETLRLLRKDGFGPPYVKVGRSIRYDWQQVNPWITEHPEKRKEDRDGTVTTVA